MSVSSYSKNLTATVSPTSSQLTFNFAKKIRTVQQIYSYFGKTKPSYILLSVHRKLHTDFNNTFFKKRHFQIWQIIGSLKLTLFIFLYNINCGFKLFSLSFKYEFCVHLYAQQNIIKYTHIEFLKETNVTRKTNSILI